MIRVLATYIAAAVSALDTSVCHGT